MDRASIGFALQIDKRSLVDSEFDSVVSLCSGPGSVPNSRKHIFQIDHMVWRYLFIRFFAVSLLATTVTSISASNMVTIINDSGLLPIQASGNEKESRTPEQQKIDSQLLYAIYQMRGEAEAKGTPTGPIRLRKHDKGRVLVDVRAPVTRKLILFVKRLGGKIVSSSERDESIVAYLPLEKLESLARSKDVKFIGPTAEAVTN
jgi:hypothetical protein